MEPVFFASPAEFRSWLEAHHDQAAEVLVGLYKKHTGKPGLTWKDAVDVALCFGWIDSIGRRIDDAAFHIRFTPRKARSRWSNVNIRRISELIELGLMHPAGLKAFEERLPEKSGLYSHEQGEVRLDEASTTRLIANEKAWSFFQAQPKSYQKAVVWWIISAKKDETRQKRLAQLIDDSESQRRVAQFSPPRKT